MSPTAATNHLMPLRALVSSVCLLGGLALLIAAPVHAAPPASPAGPPPTLAIKQLTKAKPPAKRHRGVRPAHKRVRAAAYHRAGTGGLWCDPARSQIGVTPVTSQVNSGETLYTRAVAFQWTTSGWVRDSVGPTVYTNDYWVTLTTHWFRLDNTYEPEGSAQAFNVYVRGRYYAIARDMWWTDSRGNLVDRHYAWATHASGSYYCYI